MVLTDEQQRELARVCARHGVGRLALFGSRRGGDARPDSDLDLLVQFAPGSAPGFFGLAKLAAELSEVFGGTAVDLRTPRDLSRHFRDEVVENAEVLFAA